MTFWLYATALGFLFTHELDAMTRHEWRMLPGLRLLTEHTGRTAFVWLHVPFFALLIASATYAEFGWVQFLVAAFCVVHVGFHWLFRNHPANEFDNPGSQALIWGAGIAGAATLLTAAV